MDEREFQELLACRLDEIEEIISRYLPEESGFQKTVLEAMNYSMLAGGKRLRPMLMQETFRLFGGKGREIEPFMAAIEMIHTYSLVHDDLPAMDNDEYRRGRKTTHMVYGEAMGILAGDGLLNFAYETAMLAFPLEEDGHEMEYSASRLQALSRAFYVLARKSGVYGMIGGQTADIEAEGKLKQVTEEQLLFIHENKTAALIQASMMIGAILAGASQAELQRIEKCAEDIGVAFQIEDDILDIIGDSEELGKAVGSDEKNRKQTYVTINGLEKSREDAARLSEEAVGLIDSFGYENVFLKQLILMLVHRRK